jgi:hypothetical protein
MDGGNRIGDGFGGKNGGFGGGIFASPPDRSLPWIMDPLESPAYPGTVDQGRLVCDCMSALAAIIGNATMFKSMMTIADKVLISFLAQLLFGTASYAQQTTGQLLISSGFNPIAATTPEMVARLNSFPANQFLLRSKGGRPYYVYADPSGCGCAYVGTVAAMDKYRASFGALPADTLSSGGFTNPEQNMINSMEQDDASAQFNNDVFGPNF